ncbi:hypothetical protein [Streptomyces pratensis]|uniref:hypothetical protein n=1 Tax=Streptomyces pratensis TaxID=1169025 RepID=UPI00363CA607
MAWACLWTGLPVFFVSLTALLLVVCFFSAAFFFAACAAFLAFSIAGACRGRAGLDAPLVVVHGHGAQARVRLAGLLLEGPLLGGRSVAAGEVDRRVLRRRAAAQVQALVGEADTPYGNSWTGAAIDTAIGIPDVNNDRIPDIWARFTVDGSVKVYHPSKTNANGPAKTVISGGWGDVKAFG